MTNKRQIKKALFTSIVSLMVCFSMLLGTTFAWFTDTVSSNNNIIVAGNLDVELDYWNGSKWLTVDESDEILDKNALWEPGYTEVVYFRIANAGSLAFKYKFGVNIVTETDGVNQAGDTLKLSDYIYFDMVDGVNGETSAYATREDAMADTTETVLISAGYAKDDVLLAKSQPVYMAMIVYMPTSVDNKANHNGEYIPSIELGINVHATQYTSEYDGFGNDYDAESDGNFSLSFGFENEQDLLSFAPVAGDAQSSGLSINNQGQAVVDDSGAWYTAEADTMLKEYSMEYDMDISNLDQGESIVVDAGDSTTWNSTPIYIERGSAIVYYGLAKNEYIGKLDGTNLHIEHTYACNDEGKLVITTIVSDGENSVSYNKAFAVERDIEIYWDIYTVSQSGVVTMDNFTHESKKAEIKTASQVKAVIEEAEDGDVVKMPVSLNTSSAPVEEPLVIENDITLVPNGMYFVSQAESTFEVVDGGKLTVTEGSFTIKNTSTNGAAVVVDGGEFVMEGGSFDAHTAVKTVEGKSSTVTLAAGWSNRVTVAFDSKGDDTINVTGGTIYSSAESLKTTAGTHVNFNMSGGLLSSKTTQYSAAVKINGTGTVNISGGKIENTYSSGYNGSPAISAPVAPTTINLSGTAALSSNGVAVMLGDKSHEPEVATERFTFNMSGDATINATSLMGFGIRFAQDCCDVTIGGNAKVNATFQAIQFNTNNYVYTNSTLTIKENATITSTAGRIGGGYAIAANGKVIITGGTIYGSTAGVASFQIGSIVIIDNSTSGTPININSVEIADGVDYTVNGNPNIG